MVPARGRWRGLGAAGLLFLVAAAPRLRLAFAAPGSLDADESVILLMAMRIARLEDLPVFHYGNSYLGSMDAFLAAAMMKLGGISAPAGRTVSVLLSGLLAVSSFHLGRRIGGAAAGWIAGFYTALGPALLVIWGSKLHLGYLDIVILGNFLFLILLGGEAPERRGPARGRWRALIVGLTIGVGLWCHVLFLPYILSAVAFLLLANASREKRRSFPIGRADLLRGVAGFSIGALPLLIYNVAHRGATFEMLTRGVAREEGAAVSLASGLYNLLAVGLPAIMGAAPPWRFYRAGFSMVLPAPLAQAILLSVGLAISMAFLVLANRWPRRGSEAGSRASGKTGALARAFLPGALWVAILLFAIGLASTLFSIDWDLRTWEVGPGLPSLPFRLALQELGDTGMLSYLIFAPLLLLVPALLAPGENAPAAHEAGGSARAVSTGEGSPLLSRGVRLLVIHAIISCALYAGTSYGITRSPRFLFPLYSSLPVLFAVAMVEMNRRWRHLGHLWTAGTLGAHLLVLLSFPSIQALQPLHYVESRHAPTDYGRLARKVEELGARDVYATYWTGFPLAFESRGRIRVSTGGRGRVAEFDREVAAAADPVFVYLGDRFDEIAFRSFLDRAGLPYQIREVPPFRILHGLDMDRLRSPDLWPVVLRLLSYP
jgi:hypothetical protein